MAASPCSKTIKIKLLLVGRYTVDLHVWTSYARHSSEPCFLEFKIKEKIWAHVDNFKNNLDLLYLDCTVALNFVSNFSFCNHLSKGLYMFETMVSEV